ncbi:MAG: hypothetical protein B7X39_03815 [Lysobacterales bacterium 14-68-21]|nr:MAG: hypothetical protein B7X45_00985 [Xanthomonadales bacterium 15-68-25]OZB67686.1 MAG: hypothetical protein B7X39_03815 [Xanthomonadales bacterium 14-68-21]
MTHGRTRGTPTASCRRRLRRQLLSTLAGLALAGGCAHAAGPASAGPVASTADGSANEASFDRSMLSGAGQNTTDLSRFERGDFVPAGAYSVDLFLNGRPVGRNEVRFAAASPDASATPCFTRDLLDQLGLHPAAPAKAAAGVCTDLTAIIPGASVSFDMGDLRLDVSVPQAFMGQSARGYVDPKFWESGITAGLLNYNFNSYRTSSGGVSQTSSFLGLDAGLNVGRWHLRHQSTLSWQSGAGTIRASRHWQNIASYAQRDLPGLRAQLTLGDSWTSGEIFDSIGLRGVQLATDDRMLPQSLRGYAPTVRGVADSNAKVTIRQNGMVIYQTTVAPGPFLIDDLYATGYGGDLQVSVTEANGRVHGFSVPYASVPQLLRPHVTRFGLAAGQVRQPGIVHEPGLVQGTIQHGFGNLLTGYGGIVGSQGYASALVGAALNTRYGAFAMDVATARTRIPGMDTMSGQSLRLSYSKIMAPTGTSLTVAAYRHSTGGYLSLGDAVRARDYARRGLPVFATMAPSYPLAINGVPVTGLLTPAQQAALAGTGFTVQSGVDRQRNNFSLTLTQMLGEAGGSLYVNGSVRDYWNRGGTDTQFQLGYNNQWGRVSYNLSASRELDPFGHSDNRFMASFTIPLGNREHSPVFTGSLARDSAGGTQQQATLTGSAGDANQFSYGITGSHDNTASGGNPGNTASVTGSYRGTHTLVNAGFGKGSGYSQASLNLAGGIVAHPGGVTFGQPMGDTVAIVEAPGAAGARVGNATGLKIDRHGYALVPYLTPYVMNTITIDPNGLPLDVQLANTSTRVAPRAGSVVLVKFATETGRFMLIQARLPDGRTLPFGAEVHDAQDQVVGVVGQAGRIMARVSQATGKLSVDWSDQDSQTHRCSFDYRVPAGPSRDRQGVYATEQATCLDASTHAAARSANG